MPVERRDLERALKKKGFSLQQGSRDHDVYVLERSGKTEPIYTKISRGSGHRTLGDNLLSRIRYQLKLTRDQFQQFLACPLTAEGYIKCMVQIGALENNEL
jgi:hypothetical protein